MKNPLCRKIRHLL